MRADVYPAAVHFSFGPNPYPRSRVLVTADRVTVLVESGIGVGVLYDARLENVYGDQNMVVATTADGDVTISRQSGCGCGSRLKSYRPYTRMVAMARVPA